MRYLGKKVRTPSIPTPPLNSPFHCRWIFNITLFIGAIFGIAMGGSLSFAALASLAAVSSVGVGGNIPVDATVFLGLSFPVFLVPPNQTYRYVIRFYACFSPISTHILVHLVDSWTLVWLSGVSCVLINPLNHSQVPNSSLRLLGLLSPTSRVIQLVHAPAQTTWVGVTLLSHSGRLCCFYPSCAYSPFPCMSPRVIFLDAVKTQRRWPSYMRSHDTMAPKLPSLLKISKKRVVLRRRKQTHISGGH